jgi:hypothetical protein
MIWAAVVTIVGLPAIALVAWAMWLGFAALIAKWYGIEGLKVIDKVGSGFRPREWASLGHSRPSLSQSPPKKNLRQSNMQRIANAWRLQRVAGRDGQPR